MGISTNTVVLGIFICFAAIALIAYRPQLSIVVLCLSPLVKSAILPYIVPTLPSVYFDVFVAALIGLACAIVFMHSRGGQVAGSHNLRSGVAVPILYIALLALLIIMYPYTRAPEVGSRKILLFSYVSVCVIAPSILIRRREDLHLIVQCIMYIGIAVGVLLVFLGRGINSYESARITLGFSNPLGPSELAASSIIIALLYILIARRMFWLVFFIPLCLFGMILTGSRGSILGIPVVLGLILWSSRYKHIGRGLLALVFAAVIFGAILLTIESIGGGQRLNVRSLMDGFTYRVSLIQQVIHEAMSRGFILGGGPGDSAFSLSDADFWSYPHNSIAEAFADLGLVGMILILVLFGLAIHRTAKLRSIPSVAAPQFIDLYCSAGVAAFYIMMSLKSNSLFASFNLWIWCSIFLHSYTRFYLSERWSREGNGQYHATG